MKYGRKYKTHLCWFEIGENLILSLDMVHQTTEKIKMIEEKMRVSQSTHKNCISKKRHPFEFQKGDNLF